MSFTYQRNDTYVPICKKQKYMCRMCIGIYEKQKMWIFEVCAQILVKSPQIEILGHKLVHSLISIENVSKKYMDKFLYNYRT